MSDANKGHKHFEIRLPLFEGPFDLLLFFIERDELDIYDIPISRITEDFLDYLHRLEEMNVEVASEFILVAAKLMRIKAKMLLPRPTFDEEGNEIDPREELVKHLLEYKRYKSVVARLSEMEKNRMDRQHRGNLMKEVKQLAQSIHVEAELQDLDLYKMMRVLQKVMHRYEEAQQKPTHEVVQYPYTIDGQKTYVLSRITTAPQGRLSFRSLIEDKPEKIFVIYNFLAILDLLQLAKVVIHIGDGFNNFWIEKKSPNEIKKSIGAQEV
jgi:segregation and condensation protein A